MPHGASTADGANQRTNLQSLADQLLLQRYSPAAVLVTDKGDILYISGKTGKYLEPAAGKANWNIFAMSREGLRYALNEAFHKAVRQKDAVTLKNVEVRTNGGTQAVDITVQPMISRKRCGDGDGRLYGRGKRSPKRKCRAQTSGRPTPYRSGAMAQELQQAHEESRPPATRCRPPRKSQIDQRGIAVDERGAPVDQRGTATSKEEMQSMNEELQTVNHELQAKVDELSRASNDMKNLLNSTEIATLFLDNALHVRRFTPRTTKIIKLIPGDVGRPITDIVTDLVYSDLATTQREVLRTLISVEKEVTARDGRWFTVRIMPYRTLENRIDGVVITFVDITASKKLEAELRKTQAGLYNQISEQALRLERRGPAKKDGEITPGSEETHHKPL